MTILGGVATIAPVLILAVPSMEPNPDRASGNNEPPDFHPAIF